MKKVLLYGLAAFLSFAFFIIIFAPAAPIWSLLYASYGKEVFQRIPELKLFSIEGTIWKGKTNIHYRNFPTSQLSWDVSPLQVLQKIAEVDLDITGDAHNFETSVIAEGDRFQLRKLNGRIDANYINQVSEEFGLSFTGEIDAESISISGNPKGLDIVEGHINWNGGEIVSRTIQAGTQVFNLPPLRGDFSINQQYGGLQLDIHNDHQVLVAINLKLDGWAVVEIKSRLFTLAGLSWQGDAEDTAITYEEKLF